MPTTLIDQLAIHQAQLTIATGLVGLAGTLLSTKMREVYSWPFRMFHKAFGNKAMENKLDYLIQELTYDESGKTLKTAVKDIATQMADLAEIFKQRGLAIADVADALTALKTQVESLQHTVDAKNNAIVAKFTAMLDQPNTPPLFETDAVGECVWVSASYTAMTGRPISELLGWGWTNAIHPSDIADVRSSWERSIREERIFEHTYRFVSVSGTVTKVKCRATPIINDKAITGYIGVIEVLPKRKQNTSNAELLFIG
jgi:PAS domain S-box-containing protein